MPKIPLDENSSWAHSQVEWPVMARAHVDLEHAREVRRLLSENLAAFAECPTGVQQWAFEAQDCFDGRSNMAKQEGNLAEVSCTWVCGGNPEIPLQALAEFLPADEEKYVTVASTTGQKLRVPYYAGIRWRKMARAIAGADSTSPPRPSELMLVSYDEMCEDLASFGLSASTARHGTCQHFGAYAVYDICS
eukprot:344399-Amphidinium_carterae.1